MSSKSMTWDATADRKLLLGILKLKNVTIDYEAVSKYMSSDGTKCTISAIQNRINRLKAQASKEGCAGSPGGVDTPMPKGKGGRKKRATTAMSDNDEESPSKKAKGKKAKTAASASDDEGDEEGGVGSAIKAEEDADEDT